MSRYKKNKVYNEKHEITLYAFMSYDKTKCYIGYCKTYTLRETYRHNKNRERYFTEKFIDELQPNRPCMFILENGLLTKPEAYKHIVAWVKLFTEQGYISYNTKGTIVYSKKLLPQTQVIYDRISNINIQELITCQKCIVQIYNKKLCDNFQNTY